MITFLREMLKHSQANDLTADFLGKMIEWIVDR